MKTINLILQAQKIRLLILKIIFESQSSHIGSCFSIVEILTVLYFKIINIDPLDSKNPERDIFILSKGHSVAALYSTLAERGFFAKEVLNNYCKNGSNLAGHVIKGCLNGAEATSGSLGHGLSLTLGMALGAKINNQLKRKFYCLLGDGECNEGSVWEAIMFAGHNKLNNVMAIIDLNKQQGLGHTDKIINFENITDRFKVFGWEVRSIDGHNIDELIKTMEDFKKKKQTKPFALIANTIKGKGVSWMEDKTEWHYKILSKEQYESAFKEIDTKYF